MKTERVKAKTITVGDVLYSEHESRGKFYSFKHTITRVSEIDRTTINLNYAEGGFGVYQKNSYVDRQEHGIKNKPLTV